MYKSPVYDIRKVPVKHIHANAYNPNSVAPPEMDLLYLSIKEDGYTMPVVCYQIAENDYEIVDGYHRYRVMLEHTDIYVREGGCLPVSVIDKPLDERMASTIRHNRARGTHGIQSMTDIVVALSDDGKSDAWIAKNVGMDAEELLRLKQLSGLTRLFEGHDYSRAWIPED